MSFALPIKGSESVAALPSREGFVELEELTCKDKEIVWKETARWIKFEEDVEESAHRWGKPHIPCLNFYSVRDLKNILRQGTILLDLDENNLKDITESFSEVSVSNGSLTEEEKSGFISLLVTPRHQHESQKKSNRKLSRVTAAHSNGLTVIREEEDISSTRLPKSSHWGLNSHSNIEKQIPKTAEATTVLVGSSSELTSYVGGFVRLLRGCNMGNLAEVCLPVRFLFILLGPEDSPLNYHEIGRSFATMMSDKVFLDCAYIAENVDDILEGMENFLLDSILIPPGDWDRNVLSHTIPMLCDQTKQIACHRRQAISRLAKSEQPTSPQEAEAPETLDALQRTGMFCGGLIRDVKRRFSVYKSDITDAFNVRCLVATMFVYFACLAPAISFGGLLNQKTDGWMGVSEMIFATALSGVIFALFAGQPLIIIGATGPLLVFEQNTYELCQKFDIEFMPWRAWVGLWVMVICFLIVAVEGCFLIQYFTRFTEEIFALLISIIFIYDGLSHIWKMYDYKNQMVPGEVHNPEHYLNIALFSTIVLFGTFFIAHSLRGIRHSHFFGHVARRIVSDFGVLIAIVCMIFLDMIASSIPTEKLDATGGMTLTSPERDGWFVNPMGHKEIMPVGNIFAALIPAILVSILLFMEVEFCNVILDKKDNKLKKGPGYNLDFFIVGLLVGLCSLLGLPWMCATPVHTVSHFHALSVLSTNNAPGEHPHLIEVKEQRVTNVVIHLLIGVTVVIAPVLRLIPISVLFGVFIFLGVSSLSHIQLCERVKLLIIPPSHHPDLSYVRNVSTIKMHVFTVVQIVCVIFLVAIKLTPLAPAFPFFIICLLPIRKFLERFYEETELEELDHEVDEVYDSDLDDFDSIHVPV